MPDYLETTVGKFIFKVANDRLYTSEGLWVKEKKPFARIGVTDFFQQHNGDVAFATMEPAGTVLALDSEFASIETIKVNLSLSSPVSGKIANVNNLAVSKPETINIDPYGDGWLCEVETSRWETERLKLLSPEQYFTKMKNDAEAEVKQE
jgi:glycine cleavage system H protein